MHTLLRSVSLLAAFAFVSAPAWADDASKEPPLEYTLEIAGQRTVLTEETPAKITIDGKQYDAKLTARADRLFKADGLSFRYPATHGFAHDGSSPETLQWTLDSGNNTLILTAIPPGDIRQVLRATADNIAQRFGKENVQEKTGTQSLGGKGYPQIVLSINIGGTALRQQIIGMQGATQSYVLIIQDTLGDNAPANAPATEQTRNVIGQIDKSIQFDAK